MTPETAPKPACYPVHPVRRFIANTSDSCKPRAIRIGGWRNADGEWHCWERPLWTSGYRSTHAASMAMFEDGATLDEVLIEMGEDEE